jgi:hypothetical protein
LQNGRIVRWHHVDDSNPATTTGRSRWNSRGRAVEKVAKVAEPDDPANATSQSAIPQLTCNTVA